MNYQQAVGKLFCFNQCGLWPFELSKREAGGSNILRNVLNVGLNALFDGLSPQDGTEHFVSVWGVSEQ